MSSLIQWPSIYGTSYFVPAVVVVVLLLALLLLISSRRRVAFEAVRNAAEPFDDMETPVPAAATERVAAEAAATPAYTTDAMAAVTQPVAAPLAAAALSSEPAVMSVALAPAVLPAATVATQAGPQAERVVAPIPDLGRLASGRNSRITVRAQGLVSGVGGNDPLTAALSDILGGWGDLSPEDMKRLELFRPERLATAVAAVELPKSKSGEAKARLSQLRQYSADLERKSRAEQAAVAAVAATTPPTEPSPTARGAAAAATDAPSGSAAAGLAAAVALGTAARTSSDPSAGPSTEIGPETPAVVTGAAVVVPRESELDELASFWAEPRSLWEPDEEAQFRELPAPSYEEIEVRHEIRPVTPIEAPPNGNGSNGGRPAQKDIPSETLSGAAPAATAFTSADGFFWDDAPADPLSRLSIKVETAEELLALPPQERADMTAFLGPSELAATFRATDDPDLKRAVIDTLEHVGSPASLNALGNCFEDNDCDVQVYALEAADRLLGVA